MAASLLVAVLPALPEMVVLGALEPALTEAALVAAAMPEMAAVLAMKVAVADLPIMAAAMVRAMAVAMVKATVTVMVRAPALVVVLVTAQGCWAALAITADPNGDRFSRHHSFRALRSAVPMCINLYLRT